MTRGRVLVVCRRVDDAAALKDVLHDATRRHLVASDDPGVRTFCGEQFPDVEVCWIERMESFYPVADEVLALTRDVNRWLTDIGHDLIGIPRELMPWMQHVEGGATTQRLQDALLLIRSYDALFDAHHVERIVIANSVTSTFEDDVLVATAAARGIPSVSRGRSSRSAASAATSVIKTVGRAPYRIFLACRSLLGMKRDAATHAQPLEFGDAVDSYVFFQLASAADKHVENITPLMKALNERRCRAVALSCFMPSAVDKIRSRGVQAIDAAEFLPARSVVAGAVRTLCTLARAAVRKRRFLRATALSYRGVPLGDVLWPVVSSYLMSELLYRYCLARALARCFAAYTPAAIKPWGDVSLVEGYVAWRVLKHRTPLMFDYWIGIGIEWPYWRPDNPIDVFLTAGAVQNRLLTSKGIAAHRLAPVGTLRYETLLELKRTTSPQASRTRLGVPEGLNLYIFWNAGAVLRGFRSPREQITSTAALLDASAALDCGLIVKPHVTHTGDALDLLMDAHPSARHVARVTGAELPYLAMQAADIVVTKTSTIGLEAMLLDKPVVFLALDGEPKWKITYEDSVEYVNSLGELDDLLRMLCDSRRRAAWVQTRLAAQQRYLAEYFCSGTARPEAVAAETIISRIQRTAPGRDAVLDRQLSVAAAGNQS